MEIKGENVNISFPPVVPDTIRVQVEQVEAYQWICLLPTPVKDPYLALDQILKPQTLALRQRLQHLPFKLNLGEEAKMTRIQQGWFLDLIYDHPEVFSLHDEDLRFCDRIKHTMQLQIDLCIYCTAPFPPVTRGSV